jgi:Ca2+-binding RTX toxin-like protein
MPLIQGDDSNNNLTGTPQSDEIRGFGGNDSIQGLAGNDLIYGNQGNDVVDDVETGGNDTIFGGQGNDSLGSGAGGGNDLIYGNFGNDVMFGGSGNDTLFGGQGDDTLDGGGLGADLIYGNLGNDSISDGKDNDTVYGGQGNDTIGGPGIDLIYGNFGNDVLISAAGQDTAYGGQGDDVLVEKGDDLNSVRLFGNLGADTFDFSTIDASGQTTATADRIADFSSAQGDKIEINLGLNEMHFQTISSPTTPINSVEAAISLANSGAGTFGVANVVFVAGTTGGPDGYLLVDQNNDHSFGSPTDFAIVLQGANSTQAVHASDIVPILDLIIVPI